MNTEQLRAAFEAWANTQADKWLIVGGLTWSPGTNDYASARTNAAWAAWQAGRAALQSQPLTVDALAQEIRRVNGDHSLGAGALAEALMPFLESALQSQDAEDAERYRYLRDSAQLFSHFGDIGNSGWCVMRRDHTIRRVFTYNGPELDAAIDHARRVEGEKQ